MKLRHSAIGVLLWACSSTAFGSEAYKFEQANSRIGFSVHQFLGITNGKFTRFTGKIDIDRDHPANSSVSAQIDVRSIDTGIVKRDNHLRSAEFFAVEKYPEITFKSRSVKQTGPQAGDILGDLTMHGMTTPVTLHVKLLSSPNEENQTRWSVTTDPLKRSDFNLMFSRSAEAMSGISQTVAITIEIQATRAQ